MKTCNKIGLSIAAVGLCAVAGVVHAGVEFQTGNIQYTNVNIAAETTAMTIHGEVDQTGIMVYFGGFLAGPTYTPALLHGQHGVAFVEASSHTDDLYRMTITAQSGWAFANMDWKLNAKPPVNGSVTFTAFDWNGNVIALSAGTDTFLFDHNGENAFHAHATTSPISMLMITSTVPILNLKQVSVNLVQIPAPAAAAVCGLGMLGLARRRR